MEVKNFDFDLSVCHKRTPAPILSCTGFCGVIKIFYVFSVIKLFQG